MKYKITASDALQDYIDHFEGRSPRLRHYTRRVSDLLSPKPKFKFFDAVEKRLEENMSKNDEGLLNWINKSYNDSLKRTCLPIYAQQKDDINRSLPLGKTGLKSQADAPSRNYQKEQELHRDQDEISTLPSPHISDVEIDSDQDTVETDILVRSYHEKHKGSQESSWIKESNSIYPKWVDEVNQSTNSYVDPRRLSSVSTLLKSGHEKTSLSKTRSMDATGLTMDDVSSIDTDVILETSVYGNHPVNMGGNLHRPLFKDDRVQRILDESRKKIKTNVSSSLARSVHGVSSRSEQHKSSPKRRDLIYSERILNKHRSLLDDQYDNVKTKSKDHLKDVTRGNSSQDNGRVSKSRFSGSQGELHTRESERMRSSVRSLPSTDKLRLHQSVGVQTRKQNAPSLNPNSFPRKVSSTSDFGGSSRGTLAHSHGSKSSDLVDIHSQRTSGYNSDALSPDYRKFESRSEIYTNKENRIERPISSNRRTTTLDKRASVSRKDSNSTDILMRQPPIGTKVHQRSKTWAYLQSMKATLPDASSTPIRQTGYQAPVHSSAISSGLPISVASKTISNTGRMPPSSNPHSTADARTYSTRLLSHPDYRDTTRKGRLSDSALASRPSSSYTSWRSSAVTSRMGGLTLREEEPEERGQEPETEYVQRRYVATELEADQQPGGYDNGDGKGEELDDEISTQQNRTWPSIERLKERSKLAYLTSKQNASQSSYSSWTAEKRSIPLRPQNPISVGSLAHAGRAASPTRVLLAPESLSRHQAYTNSQRRSRAPVENSIGSRSHMEGKNRRYVPDDDDDDMTVDTDMLLSQPPMPIVDASPSVTTLSDGDDTTIQDGSSDSDSQSFAELPVRSSSRVSFAPDISFSRSTGISPLSKFESTNPRTAGVHLLRNSIEKSIDRTSRSQAFKTTNEPKMVRAELLDSFIEDCVQNNDADDYKRTTSLLRTKDSRNSLQEEPRPVETLKNMLLNLSEMGPDDEKPVDGDTDVDEELSDTTEDAASVIGEQSLARAYHHLERLKSLISGKVDS